MDCAYKKDCMYTLLCCDGDSYKFFGNVFSKEEKKKEVKEVFHDKIMPFLDKKRSEANEKSRKEAKDLITTVSLIHWEQRESGFPTCCRVNQLFFEYL